MGDINPGHARSEGRPSEQLVTDLTEISELAARLNVTSPGQDFDLGLTTDDMLR